MPPVQQRTVQQFTPEERNCLVMAYQLHMGTHSCYRKVTDDFTAKFPTTRVPNKTTIRRMWKKQQ